MSQISLRITLPSIQSGITRWRINISEYCDVPFNYANKGLVHCMFPFLDTCRSIWDIQVNDSILGMSPFRM